MCEYVAEVTVTGTAAEPAAAGDTDESLRLLISASVLIAPDIDMQTFLNVFRSKFHCDYSNGCQSDTCTDKRLFGEFCFWIPLIQLGLFEIGRYDSFYLQR